MYHLQKTYRPFFWITYIGEGFTVIQRFDLEANLDESLWTEIKQKGESILLRNIYTDHQGLLFRFGIVWM